MSKGTTSESETDQLGALPDIEFGQFGSCSVWTDGSLSAAQAMSVLSQGEGDAGLKAVGAGGRGGAWQLTLDGQAAVLRHYRRGGLMARVNRDLYVWQGLQRTRSFEEFALMLRLSTAGLPVPRPLAAMAQRSGLFYRAALLTRFVEHRGALCHMDSAAAWHAAGCAIARLHAAGVWHADLNVYNILIDASNHAWLIDFDRASAGVSERGKLQENLSRLLRSARKVCPDLTHQFWPALLDGYAGI